MSANFYEKCPYFSDFILRKTKARFLRVHPDHLREIKWKKEFPAIIYWEETVVGDFIGSKGCKIIQTKLILYPALTSGLVSRMKENKR